VPLHVLHANRVCKTHRYRNHPACEMLQPYQSKRAFNKEISLLKAQQSLTQPQPDQNK
jgi:hypothetical protein